MANKLSKNSPKVTTRELRVLAEALDEAFETVAEAEVLEELTSDPKLPSFDLRLARPVSRA